jgi:hypothetical protein
MERRLGDDQQVAAPFPASPAAPCSPPKKNAATQYFVMALQYSWDTFAAA